MPKQSAIGLVFCGKGRCPMPETARHRETEISKKKYCETTIGELRKAYGADFAKGCADNEKITDVLRKLPSLRRLIRDREALRFEQIEGLERRCDDDAVSKNRRHLERVCFIRFPLSPLIRQLPHRLHLWLGRSWFDRINKPERSSNFEFGQGYEWRD
jgi:hypothetical protein